MAGVRRGTAVADLVQWVESLLAAGVRALVVDGNLVDSRERFDRAYDLAERNGDGRAMALAALGLGGLWVHEHRTAAASARLRSRLVAALAAVEPGSSLALRLRVRLAGEDDYQAGRHESVVAALDEARRARDPQAWMDGLSLAHHCVLGPDHGALRRELAAELIGECARTGRRSDALMGLLWQTVDLFLDADPHAQRRLVELRALVEAQDHLAVGFVVNAIEVMLAIRAGRLAEAEAMAHGCAQRGSAAGDIDAAGWYGGQLVAIRWYQGRLAELVPMLDELVHSPTLSTVDNAYFAALAVAAAQAGDRRTAAGALATLRGRDLAELPRSSSWLVTMNGVVEAANLLGDTETAARAYELLSPFGRLPAMVSLGVACFGSTEHALGVAALTLGELDRAAEHLAAAVRANLALRHWPAVVASRLRYAQALAARGEVVEARRERAAAAEEAAALDLPVPDFGRAAPAQAVTCHRHGRDWRISLGHRSVTVPHSVGAAHLAVLIANPAAEIHAADLVTGLDAVREEVVAQPVLDELAYREYRDRLARLRAELDDLDTRGDEAGAARARAEHDWLLAELGHATGLGGKARAIPDGAERARIAVGKAIRRTLARLSEADAVIGAHLRDAVHTGVRCSYRPV
ncbi:hypothetical protein [Actinokineospora sp. NBRC 105648]|uniref:hypothetical protein n=1 Tax=Actinokineospora sp. NBRC 105648 TaxID=3032206 RepID=UPI002556621D|nr:hypothetical protein [Actinokineospora sp. NBRC 105648]